MTHLCQYCRKPVAWDPDAPGYRCGDPDCNCSTFFGRYRHVGPDCHHFLWALEGLS